MILYRNPFTPTRVHVGCLPDSHKPCNLELLLNLRITTDLETFSSVTNHPILRGHIKEIVYDAARFKQLTITEYLYRFCDSLDECIDDDEDSGDDDDDRAGSLELRQHPLVKDITSEHMRSAMYLKHKDIDVVKDGYIAWQNNALYEAHVSRLPTVVAPFFTCRYNRTSGSSER